MECKVDKVEVNKVVTFHLTSSKEIDDGPWNPPIITIFVKSDKKNAKEAVDLMNKKFRVFIEPIEDE